MRAISLKQQKREIWKMWVDAGCEKCVNWFCMNLRD